MVREGRKSCIIMQWKMFTGFNFLSNPARTDLNFQNKKWCTRMHHLTLASRKGALWWMSCYCDSVDIVAPLEVRQEVTKVCNATLGRYLRTKVYNATFLVLLKHWVFANQGVQCNPPVATATLSIRKPRCAMQRQTITALELLVLMQHQVLLTSRIRDIPPDW